MITQLALGYADRHDGQAAALAAATAGHRDHRQRAEAALAELVAAGKPFTADDLRRLVGDLDDAGPNLLPSVIGVAAGRRVIVPVSEYRSTRRSRRASRNRVWIARASAEPTA